MGSLDYFKKVKHKGNKAENLHEKYQKATKGLDQDVAFQALDGGRVFGDSDRKRYDELMAKRNSAKEKAKVVKEEPKVVKEEPDVDLGRWGAPPSKPKKNKQPKSKAGTNIKNTQKQNINQDNDQTSTVTGDNNTVNQNQDNSINQMGANNKAIDNSSNNSAAEAEKLKNDYIDTIRPGTTSNMDTAIKNTQKQNINQDNDQTSTITGDNNTIWQQQDNSIRQYGGDNRSFVYQGGNSGVDTPVSAATMAGFYDVDDSPAAQAKFFDLHSTLNNDAQKKYQGMGMKTASMFTNFDARGYDPAKLEDNLKKDEQRSYDRSTLAKLDAFGDRDAYRGTLGEYKFGAEPKAVNYGDDEDDDD